MKKLLISLRYLVISIVSLLMFSSCASLRMLEKVTDADTNNNLGMNETMLVIDAGFWIFAFVFYLICLVDHDFSRDDFIWSERNRGKTHSFTLHDKDVEVGCKRDAEGNVISRDYVKVKEECNVSYTEPTMWQEMDKGAAYLLYILYAGLTFFAIWYFRQLFPTSTPLQILLVFAVCVAVWYFFHKYLFEYISGLFKFILIIVWVCWIVDIVCTIISLICGIISYILKYA